MNREKILKTKIENYLLMPILVSSILVFMCIGLFFLDRNAAIIASAVVGIVIVIELVVYFITKSGIMPSLFAFAQEQDQIQRQLLKELVIPYAILDVDGKILWGNNEFIAKILSQGHLMFHIT